MAETINLRAEILLQCHSYKAVTFNICWSAENSFLVMYLLGLSGWKWERESRVMFF